MDVRSQNYIQEGKKWKEDLVCNPRGALPWESVVLPPYVTSTPLYLLKYIFSSHSVPFTQHDEVEKMIIS